MGVAANQPKYRTLDRPIPVKRDRQKDRYDWFRELVQALGDGHDFDPAQILLNPKT